MRLPNLKKNYLNYKLKKLTTMKHAKHALKIGENYHLDNKIVATYMGKGYNDELVFNLNTGVMTRAIFVLKENQKDYYEVALFGKFFRVALFALSLLPILGYMFIDFSEMIPLWHYLGFIALICYMLFLVIIFANSNFND